MSLAGPPQSPRWLLLIHQIPPVPAYLRVKVGRRLARMGAIALKNSVYVLPPSDEALEDFQWVRREVGSSGGEATVLSAQLVDGISDAEVEALFRAAREPDYASLAEEVRALDQRFVAADDTLGASRQVESELSRLERRLEEIVAIDYFGAQGRETVQGLMARLRSRVTPKNDDAPSASRVAFLDFQNRVWVTRRGVHVDRIASAWLIRRFIDPMASFKFVQAKGYQPEAKELRFDMFDAEFSHEGDLCTFEVLSARFGLTEPGLIALAELIHDIDIKDGKFARPETAGLAAQISGLTALHPDDETRLIRGAEICEELLAHFSRKRD
jgi:hypothetical protein